MHCHSLMCLVVFDYRAVINRQYKMSKQHPNQPIRVAIRIRPPSPNQSNEDARTCIKVEQPHILLVSPHQTKQFLFDNICFNLSQQEIFSRLGRKCAQDCLEGYNCTIFAYGQTGAGKTYTMMGASFDDEQYEEHRGLIPRTIEYLFSRVAGQQEKGVNYTIRCSYLEIYNEQIIDLLNKANSNLQLREDTRKGVYVEGVSEQTVTRTDEVLEILERGSRSRHTSSTLYNEASSRSHSVFTLQIESKYTRNGVSNTKSRQFHFIDLAGSERTKLITGERLREGCNINKSLMNLSSVINALSEASEGKAQYINYRSSKLTFLLKDSLGGNSKTNLIANVHPAPAFYQETLSTLGFARRAKLAKREKASINEDTTGSLQSMKAQIKRLNRQLVSLMTHRPGGLGERKGGEQGQAQPSFMSEFVEYEIGKQTRLQAELAKLASRVGHLQEGIRQYSNNQIHLRMIISIYEDKVTRLKKAQQALTHKVANLDEKDQESRMIIDYFTHERNGLIKMMENTKSQASNQFIKELLRQAKVMRQDDSDAALRDILLKNTDYLTTLSSKLNQMKPEALSEQQVIKRIEDARRESLNREEELEQRLEQASLELSEYRSRTEQSEKILLETVNAQLLLQAQVKAKTEQMQWMQQEQLKRQKLFDEQKSSLIREIGRLKDENASLDDERRQMSLRIQDLCEKQAQYALQLQNNSQVIVKMRQVNNDVGQLNSKYVAEVQSLNEDLQGLKKVNAELAGQMHARNQTIVGLQQTLARIQQQEAAKERDVSLLKEKIMQSMSVQCQMRRQYSMSSKRLAETQQAHQSLAREHVLLKEEMSILHQKYTDISSENRKYRELLDQHQQSGIQKENYQAKLHQLQTQIHLLTEEIQSHSSKNQQLAAENDSMRQKLSKYQAYHRKVAKQLEQANTYKSKLECTKIQMDRIQTQIEEEITTKERLFDELRKEKEDNLAMKKLIQRLSQEKTTLQKEAKQQAQLRQQLAQNCIEQQKEKRKAASSEHYLKTIEHLQKSRSQQVQLKRQNEELKKVLLTLKESIKQKQAHARDIEHRSASEYDKLRDKFDSLQKDYKELEKKNEQLKRQRKTHEKFMEKSSDLKDQIRYLRSSSQKIAQKNEQMAKKIKQANMDSLKLERQYQQIKRSDSLTLNRSERESYIQKLKAQIAVLKTEKGILAQAVNNEREQRSKMGYEPKCGSGDIKMKMELQKKYNENKNLTELIFQIINQLKISVSQPKAKLEAVRSLILGEIRQKVAEGNSLKDKIKRMESKCSLGVHAEDYTATAKKERQLKAINLPSNNQRFITESSSSYKYQKYKDSAAYTKNFSMQSMRDFDKFNARLKYNENDVKRTLFQ